MQFFIRENLKLFTLKKNLLLTLLLAAILIVGVAVPSYADTLDDWQWRNPLPQGNSLSGVTYGNGTFVAVGEYGTILTSLDGDTWTASSSGTTQYLFEVTYGNGTFVAVGGGGAILTSPDGITWTERSSGTIYSLTGVTYGNSTFVATGIYGTILTSTDGVTWSVSTVISNSSLNSITYGGGTFVAVGGSGDYTDAAIYTSTDCLNWTKTYSGVRQTAIRGVTYGNGIFVTVGTGLTSPDGITWTFFNCPGYGITYDNNTFVVVGSGGYIRTSPDGVIWTSRSSGTTNYLNGVAYGNTTFVAVGDYGTILTSPDGVTWTSRSSGTTKHLNGITYINGIFITVGSDGTILTSPDGVTWTARDSGISQELEGVTCGNGTFVAVGRDGTILTSTDGVTWTARSSGISQWLSCVTYGNGIFVAVGDNGTILTSEDGLTWSSSISGVDFLSGVTYGNGIFVAVGPNYGKVLTSVDGITWSIDNSGTTHVLNDVTYANDIFLIVGDYGTIMTSTDGITWISRSSGTVETLNKFTYNNGIFVAVGSRGTILTSPDGVTWTPRNSNTVNILYGVTYGSDTFVAVGQYGTILQASYNTISEAPTLTGLPSTETVELGQSYTLQGIISTTTNPLTKVTVNVLGYFGGDIWTQEFDPAVSSFDLSQVTLDTSVAPFNIPGDYTVRVWAKTTDTIYDPAEPLGQMVLKTTPFIDTTPPTISGFTGTVEVIQGKSVSLPGTITSNTNLTQVTLGVVGWYDNYDSKTPNDTTFSMSNFVIDTTTGFFSTPGTYTLNVWAKSDGYPEPQSELGRMTLVVKPDIPSLTGFPETDVVLQGDPYKMIGVITANQLTKVTVNVFQYSGEDLASVTFSPAEQTYDLSGITLDTSLEPLSTPGTYTVRVWAATTSYEPTEPLKEMTLTVIKTGTYIVDLPDKMTVFPGNDKPLQGTIVSTVPIKTAEVTISRLDIDYTDTKQLDVNNLNLSQYVFSATGENLSIPGEFDVSIKVRTDLSLNSKEIGTDLPPGTVPPNRLAYEACFLFKDAQNSIGVILLRAL